MTKGSEEGGERRKRNLENGGIEWQRMVAMSGGSWGVRERRGEGETSCKEADKMNDSVVWYK